MLTSVMAVLSRERTSGVSREASSSKMCGDGRDAPIARSAIWLRYGLFLHSWVRFSS